MANILQVENLTKSYGDAVLFNNISFSINEGQKIGLIGVNGSGKTSLLNIIVDNAGADSGAVVIHKSIKVGYLEQDPRFPADLTVMQACFHSKNEKVCAIEAYRDAMKSNNETKLQEAIAQMDLLKAWEYQQEVTQILSQLKIVDLNQKISELSRGQIKRIALANVLINEPDMLILDEPTNHLDLDMVEWLEEYLNRSRLGLLMVTHDRYFLDRVCTDILEIDNRQIYQYKGTYSYYLEKRQERVDSQNIEIEKANNLLRKELEWMRRQPQARGTKAKYRVDAFYELEEKAKQKREQGGIKLSVNPAYIGKKIFEALHVYKSFDKIKILDDFNYVFSRYEKMGIVGNNGTGKTTFVKLLLGEMAPDTGMFDIGETVRFGYYSQSGFEFDENMKVIDIVKDIAEVVDLGNGQKLSASQFLQHFMFSPEKQHNYIAKLSGGERRRLYLCTVLISNPNFLVLDEPTNDLDILTLNTLEDYLQNFNGCVIVVSHDRYFMDKTVDHLLAFNGNAEIKDFPGNYTDYREWKENIEKEKTQEVKANKSKQNEPRKVNKKKKLSYKEQQEFDLLEKEIALMETEKANIEANISSIKSPDELLKQSLRISELIEQIEIKSTRWLELSIMADEA